ncbi:hypothetical protein RJT34_15894 [Clitoria ternatea]|uniref:Uncharacterized protein n=1 Tax=Clitoria ternatea TaxID=43366 RepID=A0AAN9J6G0_CLITE
MALRMYQPFLLGIVFMVLIAGPATVLSLADCMEACTEFCHRNCLSRGYASGMCQVSEIDKLAKTSVSVAFESEKSFRGKGNAWSTMPRKPFL